MVNFLKLSVLFSFFIISSNLQSRQILYPTDIPIITKNSVMYFDSFKWYKNSDFYKFQVQNLCSIIGLKNYEIINSNERQNENSVEDEKFYYNNSIIVQKESLLNSSYGFISGNWFYRKNVLQGKFNLPYLLSNKSMYKKLYRINIKFNPLHYIKFINIKLNDNIKSMNINSSSAILTLTGEEMINSRIFIHPENDFINSNININISEIKITEINYIMFKTTDLISNSLHIKTDCTSSLFNDVYYYE